MTRSPRLRTAAAVTAYATLSLADAVLAGRSEPAARRVRHVTKPLLMPALALAYRSGTPGTGAPSGVAPLTRGVAAAQAFSWGGDVALLGRDERAFLAGVGSFFAAHLAYVAGFAAARGTAPHSSGPGSAAAGAQPERWARRARGARTAAAVWVTAGPAIAAMAGRRSRRLAAPVAAYSGVLATMYGASTALDPALPASARARIRAGTTLFLVSDTLLGLRMFVLDGSHPALERAVMTTYTAGQGLIAWGAAEA